MNSNNSFTKFLEPSDYVDIQEEVNQVQDAVGVLKANGVRIEIPHPHRWWEYATALHLLKKVCTDKPLHELSVLDVGSGWGAVCPSMSYVYGIKCIENEPGHQERQARFVCNHVLNQLGKPVITVTENGLDNLWQAEFDAVYCVSVIEHVGRDLERETAWRNLCSRVRPGGLLFLTMDAVDTNDKPHVYDEYRVQPNYTPQDLQERVELVKSLGFESIGIPDYEWKGENVHDFNFFRMAFVRDANVPRTG